MGASFNVIKVSGNKDRAAVKADFEMMQEDDRYQNGHSYSGGFGMARGLAFTGRRFPTQAEAEAWLDENCEKWAEAKAVRIGEADDAPWLIGAVCAS